MDSPATQAVLAPEAESYLVWLAVEKGRASSTLAAYRRDLVRYETFLEAHGLTLANIGEDEIIRYLRSLQAEGLARATVNRAMVAARGLHRFCAVEGDRPDDPTAHVELPGVPKGLPKALSEDDIEALLDAVQGSSAVARRDRAMLEVLYGTGLRISELVGLSLSDLDLDGALLRAFGKGAKERIVPVGRLAHEALQAWLGVGGRPAMEPKRWASRDASEAVFLNARGGRLSRQGAWGVVKKHGLEAGLQGRLTPHVLRHSCATHMLDHGADIRTVQELLGHASVSTTQIYTKVSQERLREVYRSAHPRATR